MPRTLLAKIIEAHKVKGKVDPGERVWIRIDQVTADGRSASSVLRRFEGLGLPRARTDVVCFWMDASTAAPEDGADARRYVQTCAAHIGAHFSCPGNGAADAVHLERFAVPGGTLATTHAGAGAGGGVGMVGLVSSPSEAAAALAGRPLPLAVPKTVQVRLRGALPARVSETDTLLELLRRLGPAGALRRVLEFAGEGADTMPVPRRAAICGGAALLGATSALFGADATTAEFLRAQDRLRDRRTLRADEGAAYDEFLDLDLAALVPLAGRIGVERPVCPITELAGTPVQQVGIGGPSCGTAEDLALAAGILRARGVAPGVDLAIIPATRRELCRAAAEGTLSALLEAGARLQEPGLGPFEGDWERPPVSGVSVRTGGPAPAPAGTPARTYVVGVAAAAFAAREGTIQDPRGLGTTGTLRPPRNRGQAEVAQGGGAGVSR